jgi:hypothetical protein
MKGIKEEATVEIIGESVDRLITVEMRQKAIPLRGLTSKLHGYACKKLEVISLTLLASQKILDQVKENDNVFIMNGFSSVPHCPHGETDGPLGSASIARAINLGLKAKPLFIVSQHELEPLKFSAKAAGLNIEPYEIVREARHMAAIIPFSHIDDDEAKSEATKLFDQYKPKAVFSFETMGPNRKGRHHSVLGFPYQGPKLYHLFDEAQRRGILTIAGIDGGNELGSGNIEDEVRRIVPHADVCQCPCRSGMACRVTADVTIPASASNWAAYGISAMLAYLLKKPEVLQEADTECRMLEACVMAGGADGMTFRPIPAVDGMSSTANQCIVSLLHEIIGNGLVEEAWGRENDSF